VLRTSAVLSALLALGLACAHGKASLPVAANLPPAATAGDRGTAADELATEAQRLRVQRQQAQRAERLATIRAQVDTLLATESRVLWEVWTTGHPGDLEPGLASHAGLFAPATLAAVKEARDAAQGDERRALSLLHAFLVGEHLGRAAPPVPPAPVISWDARAVAISTVPSLLSTEPDAARRGALEHAWAEAERGQAHAAEGRWRAIAAAAGRLGYSSLLTLAAELRGEPVEALAALAEGVLASTDASYRALLDALGRVELGKGVADLRGRDLPRLFRAGEDSRTFPAASLATVPQAVLAGVGLALAAPPALVVDAEARPGKDPRALALPVEVPDSVRLSYTASGGAGELRGLLHEVGAAVFYARITSPVLEFRRLGAVTADVWASLFEGLAGDPGWLAERTGLAEGHLAPLIRAAAARRLHQARRFAARVLVELARANGRDAAAARAILERAFARTVEADELDLFLADRDPLLAAADGLRALLLAAQAEQQLVALVRGPWWRSPASGVALTAEFAEGSRLAPADLARALGAATLDGEALADSARARAAAAGLRLVVEAPRVAR